MAIMETHFTTHSLKNPPGVARIWFHLTIASNNTYQTYKTNVKKMLLRNKHACMLNKVTKAPLGMKIKQLKSITFYFLQN